LVPSSLRSRVSAVAATLLALAAFAAAGRAAPPQLPRTYPAAGEIVVRTAVVRSAPSARAKRIALLHDLRKDFRPQIVLALELRGDSGGKLWYRIAVPGRPNGRYGWIRASAASLRPTVAEIVIDRSARTLELRRGGAVRLRTRVAVGARGMETPTGLFYVTSRFKPKDGFFGSYALETSAYSKLSEWPGGGVVGVHGTTRPDLLGQAVSHGCVRVSNSAALVLKRLAPLGTPIRIVN
jgi:lipoprotein-anchoring transpeptidase ErfK/SrfK